MVDGFSGAVHKAYATREEAEARFQACLERRAALAGFGK